MQISDGLAQDAELVAVAFVIYHGLVFCIGGHEGDGITLAIKVLQSSIAIDEDGGDLADLDGRLLCSVAGFDILSLIQKIDRRWLRRL